MKKVFSQSSQLIKQKAASSCVASRSFSTLASTQSAPNLPPFDYKPQPYTGPSFEEVERLRKTYLSPGLLTYYQKPVMIVEGKKQYVFDEKGKRYLDFFGGIGKYQRDYSLTIHYYVHSDHDLIYYDDDCVFDHEMYGC